MLIPRVLSPRTSDSQRLQLAVGELSPGVFFVHAWEGSNLVKGSDGHGTISVTVKNIEITNIGPFAKLRMDGKSKQQVDLSNLEMLSDARVMFVVEPHHYQLNCSAGEYPCKAALEILSASGEQVAEIFLGIFEYPAPEVLSLLPAGGPESGGTKVQFEVRDYLGGKTRHSAGLFSMEYLHDVTTLQLHSQDGNVPLTTKPYIKVTCGNRGLSQGDFHVTVAAFSQKRLDPQSRSSAIYEVTAEMPPSPSLCGAGMITLQLFFVGDKNICTSLSSVPESLPHSSSCESIDDPEGVSIHEFPVWRPALEASFEYRGAAIIEVTPSAGMINIGNDRTIISIIMESLGNSYQAQLVVLKLSIQIDKISWFDVTNGYPGKLKSALGGLLGIAPAKLYIHAGAQFFDTAASRMTVYMHISSETPEAMVQTIKSITQDAAVAALSAVNATELSQIVFVECTATSHSLVVTLAAQSGEEYLCEIVGDAVEQGLLTQIKVLLPALPTRLAGTLTLNVTGWQYDSFAHVNLGPFVKDWEFIAPPTPQVDYESVLVSGEQREPLWVKKRAVGSQLALPTIEFKILKLDPKYDTAFDELQVWFDESTHKVRLVRFATQGAITDVSFSLDVGGMEVGTYSMVLHVMKDGKILALSETNGMILVLPHVEIRDMSVPAIIAGAIAPTEGPVSQGSLVLLGISGASVLLNPDIKSSLMFRVQNIDDTTDVKDGIIVAGPLSLAEWASGDSAEYISFLQNSGRFNLGSSKLVKDYKNVLKTANAVVDTDGGVGALLAVRIPAWSGASRVIKAFVEYGNEKLEFDFVYWEADSSLPPLVSVSASDGTASGIMGGGYPVSISISGFPITYDVDDISIKFGSKPAQVLLLEQSNSKKTIVYALVPSGDPGNVQLTVSSISNTVVASSEFNYLDDSIPEIESIAPFQVYADGSTEVTAIVLNLPTALSTAEISITSELSQAVFGNTIQPVKLESDGETEEGVSRTRITFVPQELPVNLAAGCSVEQPCPVMIGMIARGKAAYIDMAYVSVPTDPVQITPKDPAVLEGLCTTSGRKITLVLSNLKMVKQSSQLQISFGEKSVSSGDVTGDVTKVVSVRSSMTQTIVSFFLPVLTGAVGNKQLTVSVDNSSLAVIQFDCADPSVPVLMYTVPDAGMAAEEIKVLVGVENLNVQADDAQKLAVSGQVGNVDIEVISVELGVQDQVSLITQVAITMKSSAIGSLTAKLVISVTRSVVFKFEFLDPAAMRIIDYKPRSEFMYGGTEMQVLVENLPPNTTAGNVAVVFGGIANVTAVTVKPLTAKMSAISVYIPATNSLNSVAIKVLLIGLSPLEFPVHFEYFEAPMPSVKSVLPTSAFIASGSRTRLSIRNFPKVSGKNDVKVRFAFGTKSVAAIVDAVSSHGEGAIQDLDIDLTTPTGPDVTEGSAAIQIFHSILGEIPGVIARGAFIFVDPVKPLVVAISSGSERGASQVRTPMSGGSDISISISKAPRGFETSSCIAKLEGTALRISAISPAQVTDTRQVNLMFSTTSATNAGVKYGIVFFGNVADICSAACCASTSCGSVSGCSTVKSVCFALDYFDDTLPAVTVREDLQGLEFGGHALNVEILNFVTLTSNADVSVTYQFGENEEFFDSVHLVSSNAEKTELLIVTPGFKNVVPIGKTDQSIVISIKPSQDPRKEVTLNYLVQAVQARFVAVTPSTSPASGGKTVTAEIDFFEYPTPVHVAFGGALLPQADISVLTVSSKVKSFVKFSLPTKSHGAYDVVISPALCATPCTKSVQFTVDLYDDSLPNIQLPPSGGPFQKSALPTLYLTNAPAPVSITTITLVFGASDTSSVTAEVLVDINKLQESTVVGVKRINVALPVGITAPAVFMVSLRFALTNGVVKSSAPFAYTVFDGFAPRVIEINPSRVPTSATVEGRKLHLQSQVSLLCANFPVDVTDLQKLRAVLSPSLQTAEVLEVKHLVMCESGFHDCNRTLVKLRMPALEAPGVEELVLSRVVAGSAPQQLAMAHLTFVPSCDHEFFCKQSERMVNYVKLLANPIVECSPTVCLDKTKVSDPVVLLVSPKAGGAGTQVEVLVKNLPAFAANDVSVIVLGTLSKQRVSVSSLQQDVGSTLMASQGVLRFEAPQFMSPDVFAKIQISTIVGGKARVLAFPFEFEYLPQITGRAQVVSFSPASIMQEEALILFVTVQNVHRIDRPYSADQLLVQVAGVEIAPPGLVSIISSDRTATSLRISMPASAIAGSSMEFGVGSKIEGSTNLGLFSVDIVPTPLPVIISSFPRDLSAGAPADEEHVISVTVAYLDPALASLDASNLVVELSGVSTEGGASVDVLKVVSTTAVQSCTARYCSVIEFMLKVPALDQAGKDTGGTANMTIKTAQQEVIIDLAFDLTAAGEASVVLVQPAMIPLGGNVEVTVFLKNFPDPACKTSNTCVQQVNAANLKVEFANGIALGNPTEFLKEQSNGMFVLKFPAPAGAFAGAETGNISITGGGKLEFDLRYMMPSAHVSPMDGRVSGGETITISATGWYSAETARMTWSTSEMISRDLRIKIGEVSLNVSSVVSVEVTGGELKVVVQIPVASKAGQVAGSIGAVVQGGQKTSRFVFQYFMSPQITSVAPNKATLLGKTTSTDGRSVLLTLSSFPSVTSAGDVKVMFGNTVCGVAGASCNIMTMRSSKVDGVDQLQLRVRVPPVSGPGDVAISVEYVRVQIGIWAPKSVRSTMSFFRPLPVVQSVRWCHVCKSANARTCIVMGSCGGGKAPLENLLPFTGGGTMVITVENPPTNLRFNEISGETSSDMLLQLGGSSFGVFVRVAQGNGQAVGGQVTASERVVLEFAIPELSGDFDASGNQLKVSITPVGALSLSSASMGFSCFDDQISIKCLEGCHGSAKGGQPLLLALTNFLLTSDISLFDQVVATFGDFEAVGLEFGQNSDNAQCGGAAVTCISLTQPECVDCVFERGALVVDLSVAMKVDLTVGSMASFTYWAAPAIVSAAMNTVGTAVNVRFDQNTDKATMTASNSHCDQILRQDSLPQLAASVEDASCVWESPNSLNIYLGTGAVIAPGHMIAIKPNALKSSNLLSAACDAEVTVQGPAFPVAPLVSIEGTSAIDPCAGLELRAIVDSPRPLQFRWSCRNDDTLSNALSRITSPVLLLAQGTKEMTELDKTYDIIVTATDFLGATSDQVVFPILKMSSAAPKLTFIPSTLSVFRDETVMVKVVAEFSECPIEKGSLVFEWSLASYSKSTNTVFTGDVSVFAATGSQLWVPGGVLDAEATYTLAVKAYMDNDPSKSSAGMFSLQVKKRDLVASIRGGAEISASTTRDLVLDASDSVDPDFASDFVQADDLHFAWTCTITEDGQVFSPCRTKAGVQLDLAAHATLTLDANHLSAMYPTAANPYLFEVKVSKGSMMSQYFTMPVTLTEAAIPAVSIGSSCGERLADGGIKVNAQDQLVMHGACSVINSGAKGMKLTWNFSPDLKTESPTESPWSVIPDASFSDNTTQREALIVAAGSGAFAAGSTYIVSLQCEDLDADEKAVAQFSLAVNAPPRGDDCTSCRLLGSNCATADPTQGEPIFDVFRVSCMNWADEDGSLQYQFGYSSGDTESVFDWGGSRMVDLNLPPGEVSLKARVRDGLGASTPWQAAGTVSVFVETTGARRHLLAVDDTWERSKTKLQETLALADYSQTNKLGSAIGILVDINIAGRRADSDSVCMDKKEVLLQAAQTAAENAINTPGFICESLLSVTILSHDVNCINMQSTKSLSDIVKHLAHSESADSLPAECSQNLVKVLSKSLGAVYKMRTCDSGKTVAQDSIHSVSVGSLLTDMDSSMQLMLKKSSKDLITGQALHSTDEGSADAPTEFAFMVQKLVPTAADFVGTLASMSSSDAEISFDIPAAVRADSRVAGHSDVSVLFSAMKKSPVMGQGITISPIVTISLVGAMGDKITLDNLSEPIEIRIPISNDGLCSGEQSAYSGKGKCLYWDEINMKYSEAGCTTEQSESANFVTCKCTHLTSFVVENVPVAGRATECSMCPAGQIQTLPCSDTVDRVCMDCPMGSYNDQAGREECLKCPAGKFSTNLATTSVSQCMNCTLNSNSVRFLFFWHAPLHSCIFVFDYAR